MKIRFLFNDFCPAFKCGEAISGVTSMLSGVYNAKQSSENVSAQLGAQKNENQLNRDWQTSEAEKARQFESSQVLQQNQFQQNLQAQQQQFNLLSMQEQAKYNSPVYMSQQLRNAGINPQVYFGNHGSFSGSSAQAGGSPSAPSPARASMPGSVQGLSPVGFQPSSLNVADLLSSFGSLISGVANAKKAGVETDWLEQSFRERLKQLMTQGNILASENVLKELSVAFKRANFGNELNKAFAEYEKVVADIGLTKKQILTEEEEQKLKRSTSNLNEAMRHLSDVQRDRLGIEIQYLPRLLESEILSNRGSAAAGFGKGAESRANAAVLNEEKRIRSVAANIKEANSSQELLTVLDELHAKQAISLEQYNSAQVQLHRLDKILRGYQNSESLQKVDAILQNFFRIIGLNTSVSVSAK